MQKHMFSQKREGERESFRRRLLSGNIISNINKIKERIYLGLILWLICKRVFFVLAFARTNNIRTALKLTYPISPYPAIRFVAVVPLSRFCPLTHTD